MFFRFRKALLLGVMTVAGVGSAHAQYAGHVSSFVMDARTGAVLSQTDADLQRYPASLTKLMTLYLAFRALQAGQITLDEQIPVSIHASVQIPSKLGLVPGTRFTVEQAILALVTKSANDAACALGEFLGGGDEVRFAALMTQQARSMGMSNTTFQNASGVPNPDQITTARDLATLTQRLILDFPQYYHYFNVPSFSFHNRIIPNHDPMLKLYAGADGLKTGYTDLAGRNLITSAQRGNVRLIGVVLGSSSNARRSAEMIALLDKGFADEGVAPEPLLHQSAPGVLMASAGRGRHFRRGLRVPAVGLMEVADAPTTGRRYGRIIRHPAMVKVVTVHHTFTRRRTKHHNRG